MLDPDFASFVGRAAIPMRHGLTLGELALHCNEALGIGCDLHVVRMQGWQRPMLWPDTQLAWIPPSPNLPRFEGALVYPGQVLLEGTNVSEGRGTTTPFEQCGAPWCDARSVQAALGPIEGAVLRTISFEPTFQKWSGQQCHGLFVHVTDASRFRSYDLTLRLLRELRRRHADSFAWNDPPYEYEDTLLPIDILTGSATARECLDRAGTDEELALLSVAGIDDWRQQVAPCLLY